MPPFSHLVRVVGTALVALTAAPVWSAEITLPQETARYIESPLPGYALANAVCSTCHSADYTRMQPPALPRTFWKANVVKMQKTFGAPIPDESVDVIVDYLVKTYGAERTTTEQKPAAVSAPAKKP